MHHVNVPLQGVACPKPGTKESEEFLWKMEGVTLELTHNHGSENDADFAGQQNGGNDIVWVGIFLGFARLTARAEGRSAHMGHTCGEPNETEPAAAHGSLHHSCAVNTGNVEPHRGFGHIAVMTRDVYAPRAVQSHHNGS